jgi:CxxxxCH...CXXCH motif protein
MSHQIKKIKSHVLKITLVLISTILLFACLDERSSVEVPTHPDGWLDKSSDIFHGKFVEESIVSSENCKTCHGQDYTGGNSEVSCFNSSCHNSYPHPAGFADSTSADFHTSFVKQIKWDITQCKSCHGTDYAGAGNQDKNCLTCHTQVDGPEACNTCHGSAENPAPPRDLSNNFSTEFVGVGAHQVHLNDTTLTTAYIQDCYLCHNEPSILNYPGHIDDSSPNADINFGLFASDSGNVNPTWNHESATCSNVYCHGAFTLLKDSAGVNAWGYADSIITGNYSTMVWNLVGTGQTECGSCHDLPPKGHTAQATCNGCHGRVVDAEFKIIDKKLHINGKIELF